MTNFKQGGGLHLLETNRSAFWKFSFGVYLKFGM